jgi:hypothetical protein
MVKKLKTLNIILIIFLLTLSMVTLNIKPAKAVLTATIPIVGGSNDGYVTGYSTTSYSEARQAGTSYSYSGTDLAVGQSYAYGEWGVFRTFLKFNTTTIPSQATIVSAVLKIYVSSDYSYTDFYIQVCPWTGDTPIGTEDFLQWQSTIYGSISTREIGTGWKNITLSTDAVKLADYTRLCLISSRDISATSPTTFEYVDIGSSESGNSPTLIVTYYVVTVTIQSPTSGAIVLPKSNVTFSWTFSSLEAGDYQTAYELQIDDDPDFWSPNFDTGKVNSQLNNVTVLLTLPAGWYYWRVKVWNREDKPSAWSAGRLIMIGYRYILNGAYYENGTKTKTPIKVTVYFEDYTDDEFTLNGTVEKLYDHKVKVFTANFGTGSRQWYVRRDFENITFFVPYDNHYIYTFAIQDYAGLIGANVYFQVDSFISNWGVKTITRVPAAGQVAVSLQTGRNYILRLVGEGWTYDFKLFLAGEQVSETLTTKPVFEDKVKLAYKYILADASRDDTSITVKYQDNLKSTLWVYLKIRFTNGTTVYSSNVTGLNLVQWVYPLSDNNTLGYWVELTINHASLGSLSYTKALPPIVGGKTSPWDLSPLGSFPIPATQVFGVGIILVFAGLFSTLNAEYGIVLVCMVAGILYLLGWLNIPVTILAFAMSLAVLYALGRRNIQT